MTFASCGIGRHSGRQAPLILIMEVLTTRSARATALQQLDLEVTGSSSYRAQVPRRCVEQLLGSVGGLAPRRGSPRRPRSG